MVAALDVEDNDALKSKASTRKDVLDTERCFQDAFKMMKGSTSEKCFTENGLSKKV